MRHLIPERPDGSPVQGEFLDHCMHNAIAPDHLLSVISKCSNEFCFQLVKEHMKTKSLVLMLGVHMKEKGNEISAGFAQPEKGSTEQHVSFRNVLFDYFDACCHGRNSS